MRRSVKWMMAAVLVGLAGAVQAQQRTTVHVVAISDKGFGAALGSITFSNSPQGLTIVPQLKGLPPGPHGFHVHETPDCTAREQGGKMVPGLGAGGHYDPKGTKAHHGPLHTGGHLGDLPVLIVGKDGTATATMLAPHLKVADLRGRSIVIHANGDNYDDKPLPLGGGGGRIACGVFDVGAGS
ncbi:MAG: superoxide dismutase family protein [Alphaproteobacteria bacterium]|nr:superoxide dismutase family protein [Alphaproteobacteria bacterium]